LRIRSSNNPHVPTMPRSLQNSRKRLSANDKLRSWASLHKSLVCSN
jgi:hypothetical protein